MPDMTPTEKDAMALAVLDAAAVDTEHTLGCPNLAGRLREARAHLAARLAEQAEQIESLTTQRDLLQAAMDSRTARMERAEAELAAVRARSEVRRNDDGSLDEIVGVGHFQLEQMHDGCWSANLGPHLVTLTAKGKIKAAVETDDAARGGE